MNHQPFVLTSGSCSGLRERPDPTAMTDEKKSYRVTDRRHSILEEPAEPEPTAAPETDRSSTPVGDPSSGEPGPVSFIAFVMSLGAQASLLLGGVEGAPPDLSGAKWLISILEMLRDKTEGRRSQEETQALDGILYELRMGYVRAQAGRA